MENLTLYNLDTRADIGIASMGIASCREHLSKSGTKQCSEERR